MDAISILGDRVVAYRPILRTLRVATTVPGTLLASQLLWEYQQHGRQPFTVKDIELASRTGLSVDEIRSARADITAARGDEKPCFSYQRKGFPPKGYWDVDQEALQARFSPKPQCSSHFGPSPELEPPFRPIARIEENPVTEPFRPTARIEATGPKPSEDSISALRPHHFGPSPELSIYENSLEEKEPLTPQVGDTTGSSGRKATRAKGTNPRARGSNPRASSTNPKATVDPRTAELPPELERYREGIASFWDEDKRGQKTLRAWKDLIRELSRIEADDGAAVLQQLALAKKAATHGKPWLSISHENWLKYRPAPPPKPKPIEDEPVSTYPEEYLRDIGMLPG